MRVDAHPLERRLNVLRQPPPWRTRRMGHAGNAACVREQELTPGVASIHYVSLTR
jgi:hypothetical protein